MSPGLRTIVGLGLLLIGGGLLYYVLSGKNLLLTLEHDAQNNRSTGTGSGDGSGTGNGTTTGPAPVPANRNAGRGIGGAAGNG